MKAKKIICSALLGLSLAMGTGIVSSPSIPVMAEDGIGDNIEAEENVTQTEDEGVADFFKNHRSVTNEQLNKASETVSPVTNLFGYLIGGIIAVVTSGIFLITAIDLLYIAIPPVRSLLYSGGDGGQAPSMGMGGMQGGYGRGGYGGQASSGGGLKSMQWVSDEAVMCVNASSGGGQMQGAYGQPQQQAGTKSVIGAYLKKRMFFVVLFAICTIVLTSSILLGTGVNIAQWGMKILEMINNAIPI